MPCQPSEVADIDNAQLAELATLLRERNAVDARVGAIIDRPVLSGHVAEWIAARVFDIELETLANATAIDGRFSTGPLAGRTVNVKYKGRDDSELDVTASTLVDYYLVFTGPRGQAASSKGSVLPYCIQTVYLFDACHLLAELTERGVKIGTATSLLRSQWPAAEIYPLATTPLLALDDVQRVQLEMFACP